MNDAQYFLVKIIFIVWNHAEYTLENKSEGYNSYKIINFTFRII
jgi:hypothetical protein